MKNIQVFRFSNLPFTPASHEDMQNPGALKKILYTSSFRDKGKIQMINWAMVPKNRSFNQHYHQDLKEVFIIMQGVAKVEAGRSTYELSCGDCIVIPPRVVHKMWSLHDEDLVYLVVGISYGKKGKTIITQKIPQRNSPLRDL